MKEWRLIAKRTISEETSRIDITTDDGKPFSYNELMIAVNLKAYKEGAIPAYLLNGKWTSAYPYINGKKLSASWSDNYVIKARLHLEYKCKSAYRITFPNGLRLLRLL